jgi:hypothetical protein
MLALCVVALFDLHEVLAAPFEEEANLVAGAVPGEQLLVLG